MDQITSISRKGIKTTGEKLKQERKTENEKIRFIVSKTFLGSTGRFRLGFAWIILEPMLTALIYVFLFSVINSSISGEEIIIGIGTYGVFSSSFRSGISGLAQDNGGFTAERIRTSVLVKADLLYSAIEGGIRAISMLILLFLIMEVSVPGGLLFIPICSFLSAISKSMGYNFALISANSPDIKQIFDFFIRLGFFLSPVLYPLSQTEGLHRSVNMFNPTTYFIELSRFVTGTLEEQIAILNLQSLLVLGLFILLGIRGVVKLDNFRWRVSTWN